MSQTLTLELCEALSSEGIKPICSITQQRYIEQEGLWSKLKAQAQLLVVKTAKFWNWFVDDKFEYAEEVDEKSKIVTVHLTGQFNIETCPPDLAGWFKSIDYQLLGRCFLEGYLAQHPEAFIEENDVLYIHIKLPEEIRAQYAIFSFLTFKRQHRKLGD